MRYADQSFRDDQMQMQIKINNQQKSQGFLLKISNLEIDGVLAELKTSKQGLSNEEVEVRLKYYGKNQIARERPMTWFWMLLSNFKNPFILVLQRESQFADLPFKLFGGKINK